MNVPLHVDPQRARAQVRGAIEEHQQLIDDLRANPPAFPAHAAGEGFAARAAALAEAMSGVHELSVEFLRNRVEAWERFAELLDVIEVSDSDNAADLKGSAAL